MLRIGLTGGIGCGKSTVAERFAARGIPVLDADRIARDLVAPGQPALDAIAAHFGQDVIVDGQLDRARIRELVFAAPAQRQWLEALLHPRVYAEMARRIPELEAPYCLLVIPLLLETGRRDFVDRLLVVDCPPEVQRERVKRRDGLDDATLDRILSAQTSRETRLAAADDIIDNGAPERRLDERIEHLHRLYLSLARG